MLNTVELPEITGGHWIVAPKCDETLYGGCFDTRQLKDEQIFFAWKGENSDGHNYLDRLSGTSVKVAVVQKDTVNLPEGVAILKTENSVHALWNIARFIYSKFQGKTIAITGSNGKTSAKTWMANVLKTAMPVHVSTGSFNNHLGCPITLLNLKTEHQVLILEIGANDKGEIDHLTGLFPPDIAVILNVGYAHVGKFGGIEQTYEAKSELINHLKPDGILFIPAEDTRLKNLAKHKLTKQNMEHALRFFPAHQINILKSSQAGQEIEIETANKQLHLSVKVLGNYVGRIFSLILSVAETLGISADQIESGFAGLENISGRMKLKRTLAGGYILDDSYNANPNSVAHLAAMISDWDFAKKYLILGNLAELDENDDVSAEIIAHDLKDTSIQLLTLGDIAERIGKRVVEKTGCEHKHFLTKEDVIQSCKKMDAPNVIFGIKGSNSAKLWEVTEALSN